MKDDFSIKGEVITALEDIDDPQAGTSIVDSHLVEQVEVDKGVVDVILVMEASRDRKERFAIEDGVYDKVEAIGGVQEVKVKTMTPKALKREAEGKAPTPPSGGGGAAKSKPTPAGPGAGGGPGGPQQAAQAPTAPIEGVGKVIAVASGKAALENRR